MFVVRDGKAIETGVQTAGKIDELIVVTKGVTAGDKVVLGPPRTLRDGAKVSVATE